MLGDSGLFRAIAVTVVPEAAALDEGDWRAVSAIIERALARRPARVRRQVALFVHVVNLQALVRRGRTFRVLDPAQRYHVLHALERSRLPLLRKGMWGLRTLILMGYYARPAAATAIGYAAHARGWQRAAANGIEGSDDVDARIPGDV